MPDRNPKRAVLAAAVAIGAIFVFAKLGWFRFLTDPAAGGILSAAAPVYRMSEALAALRDAAEGREADPAEIETLRTENARLRALVAENEALKDALSYRERVTDRTVAARVVSRTSGDLFHGLVIDRGSDDGVAIGQPVVAGDGVIVGKVATVSLHTAAVMLLSDSRSRLAVSLQNDDGTVGVLEGDRGIGLSIGLIPQQETISPGDTVVTSGLEPGIRRGLVVGTVDRVAREAQDPFLVASIVPMKAAEHPAFVEVLLAPGALPK